MSYYKNTAIKVNYVALRNTSGLTDLEIKVYDENGSLFDTTLMTELPEGDGTYIGSFTPDEAGQWRISIRSITNGDRRAKVYEVAEDKLSLILGLSQQNYRIFGPVYDANNNMTSATIKIYASAPDCNTNTNPLAIYQVLSTYDAQNRMLTYRVTRI